MFEGRATVLIRNAQVDLKALQRESLTQEELVEVVHRQGFESIQDVRRCELEPNGTFYIEVSSPRPRKSNTRNCWPGWKRCRARLPRSARSLPAIDCSMRCSRFAAHPRFANLG